MVSFRQKSTPPLPSLDQKSAAALLATFEYFNRHEHRGSHPGDTARTIALVREIMAGTVAIDVCDDMTIAIESVLRAHEPLVPYSHFEQVLACQEDGDFQHALEALPVGNRLLLRAALRYCKVCGCFPFLNPPAHPPAALACPLANQAPDCLYSCAYLPTLPPRLLAL